jgi:lipoprotein-anchoring transpeptidase ErfK/SrfK
VKRRTRLAAVSVLAALVGVVSAGLGGSHRSVSSAAPVFVRLPASPAPALKVGAPEPISSARHLSRWTVLHAATLVRAGPSGRAPVVAALPARAPEGTPNALTVLRARADSEGELWVEVRLPVLPNGSVGWVRRRAVGAYQTVTTHLVVDRKHLRATLYRDGKAIFSAPVGVGTDSWPTPAGEFTIRSELTRYASPFYGPLAFGTTARSPVLTDWPEGGFVGIHGTDEPRLVPGRISHGCIRLRNFDIIRLAAMLPVGTPLTIR